MRSSRSCSALIGALFACSAAGCAGVTVPPAQTTVSGARLVSLAPSITEIIYAIGCGPQLIADTRFDDYPPAARALPHVADLANVDLERLSALRPTAVLALQDEEKEGSSIVEHLHVRVAYLPNRGLNDLYADIGGVGKACSRPVQARRLAASVRARASAISALATRSVNRPRVLFLLGLPGFTAGKGSYLDDVIRLAGGVNVAGGVAQAYPDLSAESIAGMDPDIIVLPRDVPFGADVRAREPWRSLRAVRSGKIAVPPDDDIIERPGPRIVDGLAWLEKAIHS